MSFCEKFIPPFTKNQIWQCDIGRDRSIVRERDAWFWWKLARGQKNYLRTNYTRGHVLPYTTWEKSPVVFSFFKGNFHDASSPRRPLRYSLFAEKRRQFVWQIFGVCVKRLRPFPIEEVFTHQEWLMKSDIVSSVSFYKLNTVTPLKFRRNTS